MRQTKETPERERDDRDERDERDDNATASPSQEPPTRDTVPTKLDFSRTLPTGAAFQATWKLPAWRPSAGSAPDLPGNSGVRKLELSAHELRLQELAAEAEAPVPATLETDPHEPIRSKHQTLSSLSGAPPAFIPSAATSSTPAPGAAQAQADAEARAALGRTLRMEIALPSSRPVAQVAPQVAPQVSIGPRNEPRDTLEPMPLSTPPQRASARPHINTTSADVLATSVQQIGVGAEQASDAERSGGTRSTDPFGVPATPRTLVEPPASFATEQAESAEPGFQAPPAAEPAARERPRVGAAASARPASHAAAPSASDARTERTERSTWRPPAPWRMRQRQLLAAGLVLGALIGAAVLFFADSNDDESEEVGEDAQPEGDEHVVAPAPAANAAAQPSTATTAAAPTAQASDATRILSLPDGAEIILGGAIIANTPARITRPSYESDYLVRLPGYESQLVRLGPTSPTVIQVNLKPLPGTAAPTNAPAAKVPESAPAH